MRAADVIIVVPPFAPSRYPSLGADVVTSGCRNHGLLTETFYVNLLFAAEVGHELYHDVATSRLDWLVGEAIFSGDAFPVSAPKQEPASAVHAAFGDRDSIPTSGTRDGQLTRADALHCHARAAAFLDEGVERILALSPRIVGFSSVFQQNMASLALMRRLKSLSPDVITVIGGGNATQPMGTALADVAGFCDFVFSGEAEFAFPQFCERFLRDGELPATRVVECSMVDDLNAVPRPDFAAYYSQLSQQVDSGHLPDSLPDCLPFESSRGCWYGAKSQCKFCGLNGDAIAYRKKSPELVLTEIRDLAQRWQPKLISATDCIMPNGFGQDVLRSLEEEPLDMSIFYEVKASLRQEDLDQFVLSGVALLQPGIESLATNVLRQLAKGVSGIRNVWLLRECASRRLVVYWNILTAVPGEKSTDYEAMIELLPALIHLPPPSGFGDIRIDRFSPYHENAEAHGIRNLRPLPVYDVLYPESVKKDDIAYHFLGDYRTEFLDNESLQEDFRMLVRAWRAAWQGQNSPPYLFLQRLSPEHVLVRDSRPCASSEYFVVSEVQAEALVAFERPTRRERVPEAWSQPIQELLDRRYVVEHEGRYLSVVTDPARGVALRQRREAKIKGELSTSLQVDEVAASPQQTSRRRSADSAVCINPGGRNDGEIRV